MPSKAQISISIIIPVKNRWHLLKKTLNNIQNQSYNNFEIIVIDDHSSETPNFQLPKKTKLITSYGTGPGAARNTGLKHATGTYIKFFDSDDLMTSNLLDEQIKTLEESNADAAYSPFFMATEKNSQWKCTEGIIQYKPFPKKHNLNQLLLRGFNIPIPCFLFRKEIIKNLKWREDIISSEDLDYLWKIGCTHKNFAHNNKSAFLYRIHNNQTMLDNFEPTYRETEKLNVLNSIRAHINNSVNFNFLDKLFYGILVNETLQQLHDNKISIAQKQYLNPKYAFLRKLKYLLWAFERKRNKTLWPNMRGAIESEELLSAYLLKINN